MNERPIRVLWTSNITLPAVAAELRLEPTPFGGWLTLMTERLARHPGFEVGVAMRSEVTDLKRVDKGGIAFFAMPQLRFDKFDVAQDDCERVLSEFAPDIVHVEGGEMRYARRFLSTWQGPRLLSMQGVLNGYAAYELGRLPIWAMLNPFRPRLCLTAFALLAQRWIHFAPRLKHERALMASANHIIGRTLWDRAQAKALAPDAAYHHCSRILRDPFYARSWDPQTCERYSIFVGNGASPRKGVHIVVQALALLMRDFPGITLYIAGQDPSTLRWQSVKRYVGYPVYLNFLIRRLGLQDRVRYTGVLNAEAMAERMVRSHVCLMASIIENSPNTLGEAMLVGVPTVSSYAGGAPSMADDEVEALFYRADDPAMLALQIRRILEDPVLANRLSKAAKSRALVTHDPDTNLACLIDAYRTIMIEARG